jgi:mobilization protein NikA
MNASRTSAAMRGSGSEKRRRVHKVDTRWDGIEHAFLTAAAQTAGLAKGGYIRALVLGCPGPRSQRAPSVNALALAQATAALNKVGSNLNQIARVLNAGGANVTTKEYLAALREVRAVLAAILNIVGRESHP